MFGYEDNGCKALEAEEARAPSRREVDLFVIVTGKLCLWLPSELQAQEARMRGPGISWISKAYAIDLPKESLAKKNSRTQLSEAAGTYQDTWETSR